MSTSTTRQLAAVLARVEALEAEIATLRRGRARDAIDRALLAAIRDTMPPEFSAAGVHARRADSVQLATALEAADLDSAREIGLWLHRVADGITLRRGVREKTGYRWHRVPR